MLSKEFMQLRRDRLTFAMIVGVPLMQLLLFGYAINTDPQHLPTAVLAPDHGVFAGSWWRRSRTAPTSTSGIRRRRAASWTRLLRARRRAVRVTIPADFTRALVRGEQPEFLVEADASDPAATGNAMAALAQLAASLAHDLKGRSPRRSASAAAVRRAGPPALQPGRHHRLQHRAGPDRR